MGETIYCSKAGHRHWNVVDPEEVKAAVNNLYQIQDELFKVKSSIGKIATACNAEALNFDGTTMEENISKLAEEIGTISKGTGRPISISGGSASGALYEIVDEAISAANYEKASKYREREQDNAEHAREAEEAAKAAKTATPGVEVEVK